jgi:hypothetical protein
MKYHELSTGDIIYDRGNSQAFFVLSTTVLPPKSNLKELRFLVTIEEAEGVHRSYILCRSFGPLDRIPEHLTTNTSRAPGTTAKSKAPSSGEAGP